jgi:hypothetical protein
MNIDSKFLINLAAFQFGWFACVWGGANELPALGAVAVAVIVAIHLLYTAHRPIPELCLILLAGLIGVAWDSALVALGWLSYPSGNFASGFAPYWIIAMWMLFATTLNVSLGWLKQRALLGVLMGAIGGPLAYYAGFKLGGVEFNTMALGLGAQAAGWAILMPLLSLLAQRFNGMQAVAQPLMVAAAERT